MRIRWEHVAGDPGPVSYYVDDVAVGMDDAGFDRVLELVADSDAAVTIAIGEPVLDGAGGLHDSLPFRARLDELQQRLGPRRLDYEFF